ncbi:MAG: histidine kinase [Crocinitomicaceae bacterium]|nr:histidine kinase [Crocinitomicaceae bacterium]
MGVFSLALAVYVRNRFPNSAITRNYLWFISGCFIWQVCDGLMRLSSNTEFVFIFNHAVAIVLAPMLIFGLVFALMLSGNKKMVQSWYFRIGALLPMTIFLPAHVLFNIDQEFVPHEAWGWVSSPDPSWFHTVELIWLGCVAFTILFVLARYMALSSLMEKDDVLRARWLFFGYLIPAAIGIITQVIMPILPGIGEVPLTAPSIFTFVLASFIAQKKYKLFAFSTSYASNRILEMMHEGVIIADMTNKIRYVNKGFLNLSGHSKKSLLGENINALESYKSEFDFDERLNRDENEIVDGRVEKTIYSKDGKQRVVLYNEAPYYDQSGIQTGTIYLVSDVTEIILSKERSEEEKKRALRYQSMLLSSQINPHFIYNSMNSIQFYILEQTPEPALDYVSEFSKLMRLVLNNSLRETITITEEIQFLEAYLNLELKRHRNKFSYEVKVCPDLDTEEFEIPPMLLQPYVENAIIHGLGLINYPGELTITFCIENDAICCEIDDNGVGREKAMELKKDRKGFAGISHGMKLTRTRLEVLNELNSSDYIVEVIDKYNEQAQSVGTKVRVKFPMLSSF